MYEPSQNKNLDCGHPATPHGIAAGYAVTTDNKKICYTCAAVAELKDATETGRHTFYLTYGYNERELLKRKNPLGWVAYPDAKVTNWPGNLAFKVVYMKIGDHNIAGRRIDVWFRDFNGDWWWGRQYGHFSEICHCQRIKKMWQ